MSEVLHSGFVDALPRFADLLGERLDLGRPTSEDGVRYTLFAALLEEGIAPHSVVPEYPHPTMSGARIDTVLVDPRGEPIVAMEFKYDPIAQAETQRAGAAVADIERLARLESWPARYFVYLAGEGMSRYIARGSNGLRRILDEPNKSSFNAIALEGRAETLLRRAGDVVSEVVLSTTLRRELPRGHTLRVIRVSE